MYFIKTYHTGPRIDCGGNKSGGWTFSIVFLLITLVTLITFYIIEINSVAVKNHKIKSYNEEVDRLRIDSQRFILEKSRLSSFDLIKSKLFSLEMSELKGVSYLDIFEPSVAVNR